MKSHHNTHIIFHVVVIATMAATISPTHASSRFSPSLSSSSSSPSSLSPSLSHLLSDIKAVRLIHACRQHVEHTKHDNIHQTSSNGLNNLNQNDNNNNNNIDEMAAHSYNDGIVDNTHSFGDDSEISDGFRNKLRNVLHNSKSSTTSDDIYPGFYVANTNRFPVHSTDGINEIELKPAKDAFEFMEQMCLKYAFDKLLQSKNRERYWASKKALEETNDVGTEYYDRDSRRPFSGMFGQQQQEYDEDEDDQLLSMTSHPINLDDISIENRPFLSTRLSLSPDYLTYDDGLKSMSNLYNNNYNTNNPFLNPSSFQEQESEDDNDVMNDRDGLSENTAARMQLHQQTPDFYDDDDDDGDDETTEMTSPFKRGGEAPSSTMLARLIGGVQTRGKRRHRMSINNSMMTLSSMIWEKNNQRKQKARNNIMRYMQEQG